VGNRIAVDETGKLKAGKIEDAAIVRHHIQALVDAQPAGASINDVVFKVFDWDRP
jgi:hypothetical protein